MTHLKQVFAFLSLTLLIILGTVGVAHAQTFQTGDIFVGVNNGDVDWYRSDGTFVKTLNIGASGFTTGMAFDGAGNLYVTGFTASTLAVFDTSGNLTNSNIAAGLSTPESVVFDAAGNFYVGNLGNGILKYDAAGVFQGTVINTRVDWFDLSADQSTFIYGDEKTSIFTVSNALPGVAEADFANGYNTGGSVAFAMRFLPDGGVLLADDVNVKRFDASGNHIQTYDITGEDSWFSLNLDSDGTSFWAGNDATGLAYRFDIATGNMDNSIQTLDTGVGSGNFFGLAIFGEPTAGGPLAAGPLAGGTPVPEPNTLALLGLGIVGLIGFGRRKRREGK